jgi:hypothetical protein
MDPLLLNNISLYLPLYDYLRVTPINRSFYKQSKKYIHTHYPYLHQYIKSLLYKHNHTHIKYKQSLIYDTLITHQNVKKFYQIFFINNHSSPNDNYNFLIEYIPSFIDNHMPLGNIEFLNQHKDPIVINEDDIWTDYPPKHLLLSNFILLVNAISNTNNPHHYLTYSLHYISINNTPYLISDWMLEFQTNTYPPYYTIKKLIHYIYLLLTIHVQQICMIEDIPTIINHLSQLNNKRIHRPTPFRKMYTYNNSIMKQPPRHKSLVAPPILTYDNR